MPNNFYTALRELGQYIVGAIEKLRNDNKEQFSNLQKTITENKEKVSVDLTPQTIETLQRNGNLSLDRMVKDSIKASDEQTRNFRRVSESVSTMAEALVALAETNENKEELAVMKEVLTTLQDLKKMEAEDTGPDNEPMLNALGLVVAELRDLAGEVRSSNTKDGVEAMAEALAQFKVDIPKEFKLDEQQVRKLSSRSGGLGVIPSKMATDVVVANVALTTNGTEYSYELPANTVSWSFKLRDAGATLYYAYAANATPANGSTYMTLLPGFAARSQDNLEWSGKTIYFEADTDSQVVEIEVFTM